MANETGGQDTTHLFELIKDIKFAMLTTVDEDGTLRARPMANKQLDQFDGVLWFFTRGSSHKVTEVQKDHEVNLTYANPEKQTYVSVSGTCQMLRDQQKIDELWTPYAKIWFPNGKDDPDLSLLRVKVSKAEYWDSPSSKMVQLFGIAKAAISGDYSSMGENKKLNFV